MKISQFTLAFALAASAGLLTTGGAGSTTIDLTPQTISDAVLPDANLTETPAWANTFTESIGVNAHYEYGKYPALVSKELIASGIHHLRDSGPEGVTSFLAAMKYLGQHGINHSIGMGRGFYAWDLKKRLNAFYPYVDFVEPANEADNYSDPSWTQMRSDQQLLWTTVRSNPKWNSVSVAGPSFADPKLHAPLVGPLDAYENFGVLHNGTCNWNPGTSVVYVSIAVNTALIRATTVYKPIETTESGFNDSPIRGCSLTDSIIAKYLPRVTTERWLYGEPRTYLNILVDNLSDPVFGNMGLLFQNGTPKPQFIALTSLIHLLADPGSAPKPTRVQYTITGATSDVHHLLLSRRDGTYDLLIYRELPCWDHYGKKAIPVSADHVHLTIPGVKNAAIYKFNSSYGLTGATLPIGSKYTTATFTVTDAISVIHFGF